MSDEMVFYLPSIDGQIDSTINLTTDDYQLKKRFLDYLFIYYRTPTKTKRGYGTLGKLIRQIESQDDVFNSKNREYTKGHKDTFYKTSKETLDSILTMDLGELILNEYKDGRMNISINWEKLFETDELENTDVVDVESLKVQDIFSDEEMSSRGKAYKLTGEKSAKLRQQQNRIQKGKGISDEILAKRISEKGELSQLESSAQKMKWEISIPLIEPESPLSNQKIIRDAGLSFRVDPQDDVVREGKVVGITWSVPKEKLNLSEINNDEILHQELMDLFLKNPPIADIFHNKDEPSEEDEEGGSSPSGVGKYHPYEDVKQNMSVKITISFRKTQVNLPTIGQKSQLEEGSNIRIPMAIKLDTLLENTFTFGTGGKEIRGKQKHTPTAEKTLAELKDELLFLKEELDRVDEDETIKIQQQISELQDAIKAKEDEGEEPSEEDEEDEEPQYTKGEVIPELKIYFDTIKSRLNKLERAIGTINSHEVSED